MVHGTCNAIIVIENGAKKDLNAYIEAFYYSD